MGFLFIPKFPRSEASGYVADQEEDRRNAPGADKFSQWATKAGWQRKKGEAAESIPFPSFAFLFGLQRFLALPPGSLW